MAETILGLSRFGTTQALRKHPRANVQHPENLQAPKISNCVHPIGVAPTGRKRLQAIGLNIGLWIFSGSWMLALGCLNFKAGS
jgi:hypothetical protein